MPSAGRGALCDPKFRAESRHSSCGLAVDVGRLVVGVLFCDLLTNVRLEAGQAGSAGDEVLQFALSSARPALKNVSAGASLFDFCLQYHEALVANFVSDREGAHDEGDCWLCVCGGGELCV